MAIKKHWKLAVLLGLLVVLAICVVPWGIQQVVPVAQITSPDGTISFSVYRQSADSYSLEYSAGPDWAFSGWSIGGVTEYLEGAFSPDGRHCILAFMGEDGKQWYYWTDYEAPLSGGLSVESCCRSDDAFAKSFREEKGMWLDMRLRFLGWHGSKNWVLFGYPLTAVDGTEHSGHFWFDAEARYEKDPVYIHESLD